jgi:hypothetical protein
MTWEEYGEYLKTLELQPLARRLKQSEKYEKLKQQPNQSVQKFVYQLEQVEDELEPFTEQQRIDTLLNKLRPELRNQLLANGLALRCTTREEVVTAAETVETYIQPIATEGKDRVRKDRENDGEGQQSRSKRRAFRGSGNTSGRGRGNAAESEPNRNDNQSSNSRGSSKPSRFRARNDRSSDRKGKKGDQPVVDSNTCFNCGAKGHWAYECPEKPKDSNNAKRANAASTTRNPPGKNQNNTATK